jgi:DNA-binding HxlR family transcriptional regulator
LESQKNPFINDRGLILLELLKGRKTFTELNNSFRSPATLTIRLRELESLGLIDRALEKGSRSTVFYFLTEKGKLVAEVYKKYSKELETIFH